MNRKAYPEYKDSGVEWLGEIPEHWQAFTVKRVSVRIQTGCTPPTLEERYYEDGTVPWYGPGSFGTNLVLSEPIKLLNEAAICDGTARLFAADSIMVVCIGATIGKVGYLEKPASSNQQITAITPNPKKASGKFLSYQFKRLEHVLRGIAPSTTLPIMDQQEVGYLPCALPTLEEQNLIVEYLDRETERIDTLIAKKERQIELLQEKRTALISRAVTKGLDPNAKMKDSGIEWLGEIPEGWEVIECKFGYDIQLGKMLQNEPQSEKEMFVPYLKAINVQWSKVHIDNFFEMWASNEDTIKYGVKNGDLLVCEGGEVGRAGIVNNVNPPCIIQNALHRVRSKNKNNPKFLMYLLQEAYNKDWINIICNKATISHFTREKLGWLHIVKPLVEEQHAIAAFLDREAAKIDGLIDKVTESIEKLREYRTALISAAVTGKIDLRGEVNV